MRPSGVENLAGLNSQWYLNDTQAYKPVQKESTSTEKYSFSGAYTYLLNVDDTMLGRLERFEQISNLLLGTRLTPSVLWELAPWSWLTDWFWNVGDIISNASSLSDDGLVLRYGYLMRHTLAFNRYTISSGVTLQGGLKTGPITATFTRETKERVKATPYGFGLDPASFSAGRWAILGALGLTKSNKILP